MTRLYADPVEVRTRTEAAGPVPEQFLWRGRLYFVREVLARWTASGAWWQSASPVAEEMEQQWWRVEASRRSELRYVASRRSELRNEASDGRAVEASDGRAVEASSGRLAALSGGSGTYDLCFCWGSSTWSLQRVID